MDIGTKLVSTAEMKAIEGEAIQAGMPSLLLMENAARGIASHCLPFIENVKQPRVAVFCGVGNNGGDGLAVARQLLAQWDYSRKNKNNRLEVFVFLLGHMKNMTEDTRTNYDLLKKLPNVVIREIENEATWHTTKKLVEECQYHLMVDAMLGTGFTGMLREPFASVIKCINNQNVPIVAVDIPTGISADDGTVSDGNLAVNATVTVTLGIPKVGLYCFPGANFVGKIVLADLGISLAGEKLHNVLTETMDKKDARQLLPTRGGRGHKYSFGKVLLLAGSPSMLGAAVLAAKAAYVSGCGLVDCAVVKEVAEVIHHNVVEAITTIIPDEYEGFLGEKSLDSISKSLESANVIAVGPGMGANVYTEGFMRRLLSENTDQSFVIDADGLNALINQKELLRKLSSPPVITPHMGEMSRLTGLGVEEIRKKPMEVAKEFSQKYHVIVVLKDAHTIVAEPSGCIYINQTGNSALSKAGSGDVLTGMLASFMAQGVDGYTAAKLATFIHGLSGEKQGAIKTQYGVTATDTVEAIPTVMAELLS